MGAFEETSISSIADAAAALSLADGGTYVEFDNDQAGIVVAVVVNGNGDAEVTIAPDVRTARQLKSTDGETPAYVTKSYKKIRKLKRPPN